MGVYGCGVSAFHRLHDYKCGWPTTINHMKWSCAHHPLAYELCPCGDSLGCGLMAMHCHGLANSHALNCNLTRCKISKSLQHKHFICTSSLTDPVNHDVHFPSKNNWIWMTSKLFGIVFRTNIARWLCSFRCLVGHTNLIAIFLESFDEICLRLDSCAKQTLHGDHEMSTTWLNWATWDIFTGYWFQFFQSSGNWIFAYPSKSKHNDASPTGVNVHFCKQKSFMCLWVEKIYKSLIPLEF